MKEYSEFLKTKLSILNPNFLEIINQSHLHANHYEEAKNGNTHFKIIIGSAGFKDLSRIKIHQLIYEILKEDLKTTIHALSIKIIPIKN